MVWPPGRIRLLAAAAALLAATSGCARGEACAGVGVASGVGVMFLQKGYGDLAGASVELCARGKCVRGRLRAEDVTNVTVRLPEDVDPAPGPIRFRVTRAGSGRPLVDATSDAALTFQSDDCGGGAHNRGLAFTKELGLTTKIPKQVTDAYHRQVLSRATAAPGPSAPAGAPAPARHERG